MPNWRDGAERAVIARPLFLPQMDLGFGSFWLAPLPEGCGLPVWGRVLDPGEAARFYAREGFKGETLRNVLAATAHDHERGWLLSYLNAESHEQQVAMVHVSLLWPVSESQYLKAMQAECSNAILLTYGWFRDLLSESARYVSWKPTWPDRENAKGES
jgi:hypothetical protein